MVGLHPSLLCIFAPIKNVCHMKSAYFRPESVTIQIHADRTLLVGSVISDTPVPNALEGDTASWGDWDF